MGFKARIWQQFCFYKIEGKNKFTLFVSCVTLQTNTVWSCRTWGTTSAPGAAVKDRKITSCDENPNAWLIAINWIMAFWIKNPNIFHNNRLSFFFFLIQIFDYGGETRRWKSPRCLDNHWKTRPGQAVVDLWLSNSKWHWRHGHDHLPIKTNSWNVEPSALDKVVL